MLLPVVLALAVVGALAFSMTREGGMSAAAVDADYEIARVRYLAEAGITLARWQNEQEGCGSTKRHTGRIAFPGGWVSIDRVGKFERGVSVDVTASLDPIVAGAAPATLSLSRNVQMRTMKEDDFDDDKDRNGDTYIRNTGGTGVDKQSSLVVADGRSHGLMRFKIASALKDSVIARAELRFELDSLTLLGKTGTLTVHPIEREWDPKNVSWTAPWATPGGDVGPAVGSEVVRDGDDVTIRIDALVQDWAAGAPELGLLIKSSGITEARIKSFENDGTEMFVRYYALCNK